MNSLPPIGDRLDLVAVTATALYNRRMDGRFYRGKKRIVSYLKTEGW